MIEFIQKFSVKKMKLILIRTTIFYLINSLLNNISKYIISKCINRKNIVD